MGWRDRVKKSFGDSEYIGEGVENLKNQEKKRKEGLKTTFIYYPHNPQNPQNRQKEGEKPKTDQGNAPREVKEQNTPPDPAQNIPEPSPANLGPEYERLWHRAWKLANEIDNPQGAPLADRRAKLPELDRLRTRMAEIERQAAPTAGPEPETSPAETWHTWEPTDTTRDTNPEQCPAKCKRSGKCYAAAFFQGKPGKAKDCEQETCKYISNERGTDERKTV